MKEGERDGEVVFVISKACFFIYNLALNNRTFRCAQTCLARHCPAPLGYVFGRLKLSPCLSSSVFQGICFSRNETCLSCKKFNFTPKSRSFTVILLVFWNFRVAVRHRHTHAVIPDDILIFHPNESYLIIEFPDRVHRITAARLRTQSVDACFIFQYFFSYHSLSGDLFLSLAKRELCCVGSATFWSKKWGKRERGRGWCVTESIDRWRQCIRLPRVSSCCISLSISLTCVFVSEIQHGHALVSLACSGCYPITALPTIPSASMKTKHRGRNPTLIDNGFAKTKKKIEKRNTGRNKDDWGISWWRHCKHRKKSGSLFFVWFCFEREREKKKWANTHAASGDLLL